MMTPESRQKLRGLLTADEGCKLFPYTDTTGNLSIGVGRSLTTRGISQVEAFYLLDDDISYFYNKLLQYCDFFVQLDENRQIALIDMAFNLGIQGFLNFKEVISALESHDYIRAHDEMLNSHWAKQLPERSSKLANIILTGNI
jgi:lysozyme